MRVALTALAVAAGVAFIGALAAAAAYAWALVEVGMLLLYALSGGA